LWKGQSAGSFSDVETSLLARQVGLAMDAMWTWDFINPNDSSASKLRMEVLSIQKELILSWTFAGPTSPWINPVLSGPSGTRTVNGTTYKVYQIEWSLPNEDWTGGKRGAVPAGKGFQVGGTFSSASKDRRVCGSDHCRGPDAIIVSGMTLFNDEDHALRQQPHWLGFDAGTFDDKGNLNLRFFNFPRPAAYSARCGSPGLAARHVDQRDDTKHAGITRRFRADVRAMGVVE